MPYDNQQTYAKFQKNKCGCKEENCECKSSSNEDCGCCPIGTIAMYDENGKLQGCLSPNDAEQFSKNCSQGMIALYDNGNGGKFLGCVPSAEFVDLNAAVNGVPEVAPVSLSISPSTESVSHMGTLQLYPQFTPANTTNQAVIWSSSDPTKATVSVASGLVTGVASGTTTITATSAADPSIQATRVLTLT